MMPTETLSLAARRGALTVVAGAAMVLALTLPAAADKPNVPARIHAVASPWMPKITSVQLQPEEDTDTDNQLEQTITKALAKRGITVDPAAPMILYYDTEISSATAGGGAGSEPTVDQTEIGAPGDSQEMFSPDDIGVLYGENTPGAVPMTVITQVGPEGTASAEGFAGPWGFVPVGDGGGQPLEPTGGQPYSLSFTIGEDGAPPVWSGSIRTRLPQQDPELVAQVMVPPLVYVIGRKGNSRVLIQTPPLE